MAKEATPDALHAAEAVKESKVSAPAAKQPRGRQSADQSAPRPRRSSSSSMPFLTMKFQLKSFNAQKTFDRGFQPTAESLFTLGVLVRALTTEAQALEVDAVVNEEMAKAAADVKGELERLEAIADANGVSSDGIAYSLPRDCEAQVTSPRAGLLVKLIRDFDKIVGCVDALWIAQFISDTERNKIIYDIQRKVLRLNGVFRNLATRAMASTQRKGEMHVSDPRVGTSLDPDGNTGKAPEAGAAAGKTRKAKAPKAAAVEATEESGAPVTADADVEAVAA